MTKPTHFMVESPQEAVVLTEQNEFLAENEFWAEDTKLMAAVEKARMINRKQLQLLLPISPMTIWRYEKKLLRPKHIKSGGLSFWRLAAVLEAIAILAGDR